MSKDGAEIPRAWRLDRGEVRNLEAFTPYFATWTKVLSAHLRRHLTRDASVSLLKIEAHAFQDVLGLTAGPQLFNVIRFEDWHSPGILVMPGETLGVWTDVLLGGPRMYDMNDARGKRGPAGTVGGETYANPESLVSKKLARRTGVLALEALAEALGELDPGAIRLTRQETETALVFVMPEADVALSVQLSITLVGRKATMTLLLPLQAMNRALAKHQNAARPTSWTSSMVQHLGDLPVEVVARLGEVDLQAGKLLDLEVGDVLLLSQECEGSIDIVIEGQVKLQATASTKRNHRAFRIIAKAS